MAEQTVSEMDGTEISEFLEEQHTGVLSLAEADDAYAVPVSFAVPEGSQDIYFRLGFGPGSQKRAFLDATEHAAFVTYDRTDVGWTSVVAIGRLEEYPEEDADVAVVESVEGLDIPFFRVFDRPVSDIDFKLVRLDVQSMRGIVEAG